MSTQSKSPPVTLPTADEKAGLAGVSAANPVVRTDDARLPTSAEKAALAGTGTPSGDNRFVVAGDSRMTDPRPAASLGGFALSGDAPVDGQGYVKSGLLFVPRTLVQSDDARLTDARDALSLRGRAMAATAPTDGQLVGWDDAGSTWKPVNAAGGGGGIEREEYTTTDYTDAVYLFPREVGSMSMTAQTLIATNKMYLAAMALPAGRTLATIRISCGSSGAGSENVVVGLYGRLAGAWFADALLTSQAIEVTGSGHYDWNLNYTPSVDAVVWWAFTRDRWATGSNTYRSWANYNGPLFTQTLTNFTWNYEVAHTWDGTLPATCPSSGGTLASSATNRIVMPFLRFS